mmetsp:Transcript_111903/g.361272  ORF Transcript_111903/g.361272 Transcript_111903/m.361272 type:complete len:264 (-) Transcript_111903:798-1589(-)
MGRPQPSTHLAQSPRSAWPEGSAGPLASQEPQEAQSAGLRSRCGQGEEPPAPAAWEGSSAPSAQPRRLRCRPTSSTRMLGGLARLVLRAVLAVEALLEYQPRLFHVHGSRLIVAAEGKSGFAVGQCPQLPAGRTSAPEDVEALAREAGLARCLEHALVAGAPGECLRHAVVEAAEVADQPGRGCPAAPAGAVQYCHELGFLGESALQQERVDLPASRGKLLGLGGPCLRQPGSRSLERALHQHRRQGQGATLVVIQGGLLRGR